MSNLNKYIQTFNEEDLKGNKGEKYEKLISIALNYLIIKRKKMKIENTITELIKNPEEITELKKISVELDREIALLDKKDTIDIKKDFIKANEILEKINNIIPRNLKKIDDQSIRFSRIKSLRSLKRRKDLLYLLLNKDDSYLDKLKKTFQKIEYKEFVKIDKAKKNYKDDNAYFVAYEIAKNIEKQMKNEFKEKIVRVVNIGARNGGISQYWMNLFSSKNKTSKIKTDMILETFNGKKYNLSLKMNDNRFGTPKYVDIYTLILHAINVVLDKNKNSFVSMLKNNTGKSQKDFETEKNKKLNQIKTKLMNILKIDEKTTDEYATIINISLMLDLLLLSKKDNVPLNNFLEAIKDDKIQTAFEDLKKLAITPDEINDIIKGAKNTKNIKQQIESLINEKIEKNKSFKYHIKISTTNKDFDRFKQNMDKLINSFIKLSKDGKYFGNVSGIPNNIEKLVNFFNDSNKKSKYDKFLELRNIAKKANYNLNRLFDSEEELLKELFKNNDDFKIVSGFLNNTKNKDFIKKEIIREALTGQAKFQNNEKYIASHILTYNEKDYSVNIEAINDAYVSKISGDVKIKFGFKGSSSSSDGSGKSYNVMHINSESFFGDIKDKIGDFFNDIKVKTLKIISSVKKKSLRLLNFFGIKIKINKATMPQWIIDKL